METINNFHISVLTNRLGNISELMKQNAGLAFSLYHTDQFNYDVEEAIELLGYEYDEDLYEEVSYILYSYGYSNIVQADVYEDYTDEEKRQIIDGIDSCIKELTEYLSKNCKKKEATR